MFERQTANVDLVPGFGPKRTKRLLNWRAEMEASFRFDRGAGIPQNILDSLDANYRQRRQERELLLSKGPQSLKVLSLQAENHLAQLLRAIQQRVQQAAQAEIDIRLLGA